VPGGNNCPRNVLMELGNLFFLAGSFFSFFLSSHVVTLQRSETFYPWSGADFLSFFLSFSFFSRSDLTAERDFLSLERSGSSFFLSVPGERNICPRNVLISLGNIPGRGLSLCLASARSVHDPGGTAGSFIY